MIKNLITIAKDYLSKSEEVKNIMLEAFELKTKEDIINSRVRIPSATFYFDGMKHTFAFHGRGFRFFNEYAEGINVEHVKRRPLKIDMEIGYNDIWCGISPWMLFKFIEEYYSNLKEQFNTETIKKEFDIWVKENVMYEEYDLYYFK